MLQGNSMGAEYNLGALAKSTYGPIMVSSSRVYRWTAAS